MKILIKMKVKIYKFQGYSLKMKITLIKTKRIKMKCNKILMMFKNILNNK